MFASSLKHSQIMFASIALSDADMPESRLDHKRSHHAVALFGDVPMSFPVCALSYPWRQSEIARKLLGLRKSVDGANPAVRGDGTQRAHARDRHQPFGFLVLFGNLF